MSRVVPPLRADVHSLPAGRLSRRGLLVALGSASALAGCGGIALPGVGGGGPVIDTSRATTVALLVPSGGADQGQQVLAAAIENAARLAAADLSGVEIDLRVYGTEGRPERAAEQARQAVADGAQIILGPVLGPEAAAVGPAVAASGISVLSFSNNTAVAGGNVFVLGMTFENTARRLLSYAAAQGRNRVMIVSERNARGELARAAINRGAVGTGATIVATETYEFSQAGIVNALSGIAETARSSGAQVIFFTDDTAGALPILSQLLPDNRVGPPTFQFMGLTRWDIPPASLQLRGLQEGWFALPDPGLTGRFEARYQAAHGAAPHPIAGLGYDGVAAVGALLGTGQPDALSRGALIQPSGFAGVNGIFRLMPDGTNQRGLAVATIRDTAVAIIDAAPRSFAGV
jgi:hypothetical protein